MVRRLISIFCAIFLFVGMVPLTEIAAAHQCNAEFSTDSEEERNITGFGIGDYLYLGEYLGEPILWRCVDIDENGPLMLSDRVLCFKSFDAKGNYGNYYRNYYGSNCWGMSCIRHWLNSSGEVDWSGRISVPSAENVIRGINPYDQEKGFLSSFSEDELECIKEVQIKTYLNSIDSALADGGAKEYETPDVLSFEDYFTDLGKRGENCWYQETKDLFFLIGPEQAERVYYNLGADYLTSYATESARIADTSGQAASDTKYAYWIRLPETIGASYENVSIIDTSEKINCASAISTRTTRDVYLSIGIRPAFYLNTDALPMNPVSKKVFLENVYKADIWLNRRSETDETVESDLIREVLALDSLSTEMCEMLNDNRRFQNALGAWQALQVVFDPVSATDDLYLSQEDIYETLILDFLKKSTERDEEMAQNIILQSVDALGTDGKTVTKYKKIVDNIVTTVDAPVDALLETLKTNKFDPDNSTFTEFYASLNNMNDSLGEMWTDNEFIEDVSTIANVATDLKDFFMRLTAYMIAYDLSNEMVALLTEMRNQTANYHFKLALTDVINAVDHASYVAIICSLDLAQDTTIAFLDKCFDEVAKGIPVYNVLSLGYKAGKAFSDLMLNTSNLIDSYYLLEATKNFVAANRAAITVLENRYRYSGTEADAAAYVLAIESYCNVIEIDLASGIQFAKSSTEDGLLNWKKNIEASVISFIFGREYTTSYDRLVESRDEILQSLAIIFDHLKNSWKYNEEYLKTDYPAVYPIYVAKDFSQEVYTPVILSTMLNRSGESMITWQVPGCYTDKTGVTHTLYGSLIMDGAELTETVESHTQTVTVPLAAEKNTTALYNEEKFTVFPKEYSVRAFTNTDLGKVYTNAAKERMTSPCKPVTLTITKEGTNLLIGIYDPSSCYYENVKYYILRKETGTDTYEEILTLEREFLLDGRTTYIRDLTAQEGVSYTYMVISEMTFNNGKKLTSSSVNELGLVFSRGGNPQPLTIRDNLNHCTARKSGSVAEGIELSWDVVDHVDGYRIYRKACYGSNFQLIADVGSEISEYLDTAAEVCVGYEYFLVPYSVIGEEECFHAAASYAGELVIEEDEEGISHSYTATIIAPTCTEQGYTVYACSCGDSYNDNYVAALGHDYASVVTEPTCTEAGYTTYTCETCGHSYTGDAVPATGHDYENGSCAHCGAEDPDWTEPEDPFVNPFIDVKEKDYFYDPVLWAVQKGITNGTTPTTFSPYDPCTRGQIVTFLWRAFGSPEPTSTRNPFTDVPETVYYYKAILWAVEQGITTGTSATTFSPEDTCTRGQVATFLWRACDKPEPQGSENPFTDVPETVYYYEPILWAVENGITNGTGNGKFSPEDSCTRGQIVTFLYRALAK